MPKGLTRRRLATGIYEDAYGIAVIYHHHGEPKETRFDLGTPLERLKRWRLTQISQAYERAPRELRGTLTRDVVRHLKHLKGLAGYKSEKSHLRAWLVLLGSLPRWKVTSEQCGLIIARWRQQGFSARTIRHRVRAFKAVYRRLDGTRAGTPLDDLTLPKKPAPRPVSVADARIEDVALQLRKQEILGRLRSAKTRARFLVLATTGRRPIEVMRTEPADVDLERRLWFTRTAKGGLNTIVMLNDEMLAAWQLFHVARAWGHYDDRSFVKTLRRNGWPRGIRPYNLRHSTALEIRARGGDLEDVQDQLGHASIDTARQFYLHALPARQRAVSEALAGRFKGEAFSLPRRAPTPIRERDAKGRENTGNSRAV